MSFFKNLSLGKQNKSNTGAPHADLESAMELPPIDRPLGDPAEFSDNSISASQANFDLDASNGGKRNGFFDIFKRKKPADAMFPEISESTMGSSVQQDIESSVDDSYASLSNVIVPSAEAEEQQYRAHSIASEREEEIVREIGEKPRALPVIGKMPAKTQYAISFGLLIASLALAGGMAAAGFVKSSQYQVRSEISTRIQMLSQRMLATTQYAIAGDKSAADRLKDSRMDIDKQLDALTKGSDTVRAMDMEDNASLKATYISLTKEINPLVDQVVTISASLESLSANAQTLDKAAFSIYVSAEQLVALLQSNGSPDIHVSAADHIRVLSERIRRNGATLLTSTETSIEPLANFSSDFRSLRQTVDALVKGDASIGIPAVTDPQALIVLDGMTPTIQTVDQVSNYIEKVAPSLVSSRRNLRTLAVKTEDALRSSYAFASEMSAISSAAYGTIYLSIIFVITALLALALIGLVNNRSTRMEAWDSVFKNKRNEKDIIDFMEAILPLEMGDLTVRFNTDLQAMEGVTGSIRSSVNEAAISLNDAVGTVKQTAEDVSGAVAQSVKSTADMKSSNERQSIEIVDVEARVASLTTAIEQVTDRTVDAARMTESARTASKEGADVVAKTNERMTIIRGNMQDVLKSVKHLGETSHEIGDIVSTIEQITDRTQVLAVNASLEAVNAGAAGAGFRIIAGEVNRLAEQSADALRTITALVQRVQGETSVTIRTVEESTSNVVEGARLSEIANTQLETISKLASDLSTIMEEIRNQSTSQSSNAKEVAVSMSKLSTLSQELQAQVAVVVGGVLQIDQSMGSLRNTVSIFTTEKQTA